MHPAECCWRRAAMKSPSWLIVIHAKHVLVDRHVQVQAAQKRETPRDRGHIGEIHRLPERLGHANLRRVIAEAAGIVEVRVEVLGVSPEHRRAEKLDGVYAGPADVSDRVGKLSLAHWIDWRGSLRRRPQTGKAQ